MTWPRARTLWTLLCVATCARAFFVPCSGPRMAQRFRSTGLNDLDATATTTGWSEYWSAEHARPYWHNSATGETTWERPLDDPALQPMAADLSRVREIVVGESPGLSRRTSRACARSSSARAPLLSRRTSRACATSSSARAPLLSRRPRTSRACARSSSARARRRSWRGKWRSARRPRRSGPRRRGPNGPSTGPKSTACRTGTIRGPARRRTTDPRGSRRRGRLPPRRRRRSRRRRSRRRSRRRPRAALRRRRRHRGAAAKQVEGYPDLIWPAPAPTRQPEIVASARRRGEGRLGKAREADRVQGGAEARARGGSRGGRGLARRRGRRRSREVVAARRRARGRAHRCSTARPGDAGTRRAREDRLPLGEFAEAEVKHARLAMLCAAGWPLGEMWHGLLRRLVGRTSTRRPGGRAPARCSTAGSAASRATSASPMIALAFDELAMMGRAMEAVRPRREPSRRPRPRPVRQLRGQGRRTRSSRCAPKRSRTAARR